MKFSHRTVQLAMRSPFASAHGQFERRRIVLVELGDPDRGLTGHGEAAPLASYDDIAIDHVRGALEDCRETLQAATVESVTDPKVRTQLLADCAERAALPQALSAIDLALWDLAGQSAGKPVWRLLGAEEPQPVEVNWTIAAADPSTAGREARYAREHGYRTVKVKVGTGDDAGRVAAVRAAAGSAMAIRLDANGAWDPMTALDALEVLAPSGIELCEEPVSGVKATTELAAASPLPLAIDESTADSSAMDERCCLAVCLKIVRCGGISGLLDAATKARELGYQVYLASTLDGPLGIAGALHAATVLRPDRACGLATLPLFADRDDPLPALEGRIALPSTPGLGDGLAGWYPG